jgi:hypothetical protein
MNRTKKLLTNVEYDLSYTQVFKRVQTPEKAHKKTDTSNESKTKSSRKSTKEEKTINEERKPREEMRNPWDTDEKKNKIKLKEKGTYSAGSNSYKIYEIHGAPMQKRAKQIQLLDKCEEGNEPARARKKEECHSKCE